MMTQTTKTSHSRTSTEFPGMTDTEVESFLLSPACGFIKVRKLEEGEWIGLLRLAFTLSVCCGVGSITCFKYRWCFEDPAEAEHMFATLESYDDPPQEDHRHSLRGHRYWGRKPLLKMKDENGIDRW